MDSANHFEVVAVYGGQGIRFRTEGALVDERRGGPFEAVMKPERALNLAAWLVATATEIDPRASQKFRELMGEIVTR